MKTLRMRLTAASTLLVAMSFGFAVNANAADDKVTITPAGRVLLDGAVYAPTGDGFVDGVSIPDIRMGLKAAYGKWSAKIDVGFSYGKIGMKDVFIQYTFDKQNFIKAGNFTHPFGLNAATSSSMKPAMEAPIPDTYFQATGRNLGIMYASIRPKVYWGVSAMVANTSLTTHTNELGRISGGATTRFVYRPMTSDGIITHLGMSLWYQTANHKMVDGTMSNGFFNYSCTYPTRVASVNLLGVNVADAKSVFKLSPELILAKGPVALEGQYYYVNMPRENGNAAYQGHGGYALLRCLVVGDKHYGYSSADAGLATPSKGTFEIVAGWSYTDANAGKSGLDGGKASDYSLTLNYYINKYLMTRLRYSYTDVKNSPVQTERTHANIIQARIQFLF